MPQLSEHSSALSVTVVVPSFNQGRFLRDAIDSLLDQEYPTLQVLVIDGGSTDDSVEILANYGDRIEWVSEPDGGQSDAIRKGFARAAGDWITWLNSDDVQTDRALHRLAECVAENPNVEVAVGRGHFVAEDGSYVEPYPTVPVCGPGVDVAREFFEKGYVAQPSVFYRKSAYERVGGINPDLNYVMDYDLWSRFALAGCVFGRIDGDISGNRRHPETKTSSQTIHLYAELVATQRKHYGKVSAYTVQAVSDMLYGMFHRKHAPQANHLGWRMLYFKGMWLCLNGTRPWHCFKGFVKTHICKSSPIVNDRVTNGQLLRQSAGAVTAGLLRMTPAAERKAPGEFRDQPRRAA